jgi:hypothetical protein
MASLYPLAFRAESALVQRDPAGLVELLEGVMPVTHLAQIGEKEQFESRAVRAVAGSIQLLAGAHTPLHGRVDASSNVAMLMTIDGDAQYCLEGRILPVTGALTSLYLPGCPFSAQTECYSGVIIALSAQLIAEAVFAIAGIAELTPAMRSRLEQPQTFYQDDPRFRGTLLSLRQALTLIDLSSPSGDELAAALGIDDLICRCLALLLFPEISMAADASEVDFLRGEVLAEIEGYLVANLASPVRLNDLERQFSISRRTLQAWFHRRHGCGPIQWVKRRRLYAARAKLLASDRFDLSVEAVSRSCGYASQASFSRDFKQLFLMKPSEVRSS